MSSGLLNKAIILATESHAGQFDKQGQPYILHALRVGAAGKNELEQVVGFLHDTIEDTKLSTGVLRNEFGAEVADAVMALSRGWTAGHYLFLREGSSPIRETYDAFILRCKANPTSRRVKVYDINDNLSRMAGLWPNDRARLESRYHAALQILERKTNASIGDPEQQVPARNFQGK